MPVYHGRKGRIYMSTSASGTAVPVASLTRWSIDMTTDKVDVTVFGDVNKTYVQGLPDVRGQYAGFWNNSDETVFNAADSTDGAKIYLYPSLDAASIFWSGVVWVDASLEAPVNGAVAISGSFMAAGAFTRTWA